MELIPDCKALSHHTDVRSSIVMNTKKSGIAIAREGTRFGRPAKKSRVAIGKKTKG
jgi:hypothetical protein